VTPLEFLNLLWDEKPENQFILIWTWPDKHSRWFTAVPAAAEYVASVSGTKDVYAGIGLSAKDYGPARRCVSEEVTAIAGLAGDFDVLSEAHKGKPLPQTIEQALSLLPPSMPPTIILLTGNGIQAWWLLKEPYVFENDQDRCNVAHAMTRWHTMLRFNSAARGWTYERLADLARVLRVPGTKNLKDPANAKDVTLHSTTDRRYNLSDFTDFMDAAGIPDPEAQEKAAREWKERFGDKPITINPSSQIPPELLEAWMDPTKVDPVTAMRFSNTWHRRRHDMKDQTQSGYDLALADFGVDAGLSEQQIVDLIVQHRGMHRRTAKTDPDYFRRTIAKALDRKESAPASPPIGGPEPTPGTAPLNESAPVPGPGAANDVAPSVAPAQFQVSEETAKAILCQKISQQLGIEVLRLVQIEGQDPTYHMHTGKGIVEFETVDKFLSYACVRNKVAAKIRVLIRRFKAKEWDVLTQMMLDALTVEECTEEEEFEGSAEAYVRDYLAETDFIPSIENQRIQDQRKPMILDGHIAVCSSDFVSYLEKTRNLKLSTKAAASRLRALGAKATPRLRSSRFRSQSRWALPLPEFDPQEIKPGMIAVAGGDPTRTRDGEAIQ
jgi:hypothetical protein